MTENVSGCVKICIHKPKQSCTRFDAGICVYNSSVQISQCINPQRMVVLFIRS